MYYVIYPIVYECVWVLKQKYKMYHQLKLYTFERLSLKRRCAKHVDYVYPNGSYRPPLGEPIERLANTKTNAHRERVLQWVVSIQSRA